MGAHQLTEQNRITRLLKCQELLVRNDDHPFLDRLVTADEKWVYYNNIGKEKS